jgi:hypothetical protein
MSHDFDSGAAQVTKLRALLADEGRDPTGFQFCLGGPVDSIADAERWEALGVTRLIVSPWARSKEAVEGMRRFATEMRLAV